MTIPTNDVIDRRRAIHGQMMVEEQRQDNKWGEQNHPDGTGRTRLPLYLLSDNAIDDTLRAGDLSERFKAETDYKARNKALTWADILLEEIFEALAEDDPKKLREELIQSGAVIAQWIRAIDRRSV